MHELTKNACIQRLNRIEGQVRGLVRMVEEGRSIECSVADHGCGIRAGQAERIFQPFVTTKKQGLGLGLAICRSIIEAHGGRLSAENARDHSGAVFRFTAGIGV